MQNGALSFFYSDYINSYKASLLEKFDKSKVNVPNYRTRCINIFKTSNDMTASFMKES